MTGKFICIEGGEGSGKTTMAAAVRTWLTEGGHKVQEVSDPGSTELAKRLRAIVLDKEIPCDPAQQALIYVAARAALATEVQKLLDQNIHVVCGRWSLSTLIYQGLLGDVGIGKVRHLIHNFIHCDPHLYIVLDATPEIALKRKREAVGTADFDKDRFDSRGMDWHNRIREAYREFARTSNYNIVDGDQPQAVVEAEVIQLCHQKLNIA